MSLIPSGRWWLSATATAPAPYGTLSGTISIISADLEDLFCSQPDCDGIVVYWLQEEAPQSVPAATQDGKPLVLICAANLSVLSIRAQEYHALCKIQQSETGLQTDKIALREVRHRRVQLKELLDETLTQAFNFGTHHNDCWVEGKPAEIGSITDFNALLSQVCDRTYTKAPILWNELINRRTPDLPGG